MANPRLTLGSDRITAEPGGQAQVRVTVMNPGVIVDGYRLEVLGDGTSEWAEILPAEVVNVYPGEEATAMVVFSPPAGSAAPGGAWPFCVRAQSVADPNDRAVVEGDVEIGKVLGIQGKLVPVTSSGRWRGRHVITFSNWGNAAVKLRLVASDPDNALGFLIRPDSVDLPVGSSATARLSVRTRHPFLRGLGVRLPFSVVAERPDLAQVLGGAAATATPDRPILEGALNQKPILSRALMTWGLFAVIALIAGTAILLTRPQGVDSSFEESIPPPKPTGLKAIVTGFDSASLTWEAVPQIKGYEIRSKLGAGGSVFDVAEIDPAVTTKTVSNLPAASVVCFQIRAIGFKVSGPLSDEACGTTAKAPSQSPSTIKSSGPTTSGSPSSPQTVDPSATVTTAGPATSATSATRGATATTDPSADSTTPQVLEPGPIDLKGKWIAAGMYWVDTSPVENRFLQKYVADLRTARLNPHIIDSANYGKLTPPSAGGPVSPSWIVFTGPFDSVEMAQQACATDVQPVTGFCRVLQADPN